MPASANLVHEISVSTGTGDFTLSAQNGKQRFSTAFGTGVTLNVFDYFISNQDAAEWERGTGHMSATSTLVRDTVIESTNANAAVNFSVGTKNVTNDVPAQNQAAAFFNVGVFGAIADGTTSNRDAQAVQAAVDAAAASALIKTVYIPNAVAGYVFDTTVTVPASVTIRGDNKWNQGLSRIKPKAGFSAPLFQSAGYGVTRILRMALVGLTLDGSSTTLEAVQVSCQESWFQDLCIRDCFTYGLHMLGVGSAADEQALNNTVLSCYFAGQIGVVEFFNALFIDNHCADTKIINFYGEAAKDALIRDRGYNTQIGSGTHLFGASGDGGGAGVGYYSEFSADKTVSNVYIENTNAEGILIDSGAGDAATLNATIGNVNFRNINKGGAASGVIHVKGTNVSSLSIGGNVVRRDDATSFSTAYFAYFDGITPAGTAVYGNVGETGLITTAETNIANFGPIVTSGNLSVGTSNAVTAGTIELGAASDTTLSRAAAGVLAVENVPVYSNIPQNSKSAAYTTVLADAQKHILHPAADNNPRTFTIDSNANVPYPIGTAITFVNEINTLTIAITSDTMKLAGAGTTGSRTLAANGIATALKIGTTSWLISGSGLS